MVVEFGLASMEKYIDEVLEMSTNDKKVFMEYSKEYFLRQESLE